MEVESCFSVAADHAVLDRCPIRRRERDPVAVPGAVVGRETGPVRSLVDPDPDLVLRCRHTLDPAVGCTDQINTVPETLDVQVTDNDVLGRRGGVRDVDPGGVTPLPRSLDPVSSTLDHHIRGGDGDCREPIRVRDVSGDVIDPGFPDLHRAGDFYCPCNRDEGQDEKDRYGIGSKVAEDHVPANDRRSSGVQMIPPKSPASDETSILCMCTSGLYQGMSRQRE